MQWAYTFSGLIVGSLLASRVAETLLRAAMAAILVFVGTKLLLG